MKQFLDRDPDVREIMNILENADLHQNSDIPVSTEDLQSFIMYLRDNIRLETAGYSIHSHRKIVGTFLIFIRRLIHGETRRYSDPLIHQQNYVNYLVFRIISSLYEENCNLKEELLMMKNLLELEKK